MQYSNKDYVQRQHSKPGTHYFNVQYVCDYPNRVKPPLYGILVFKGSPYLIHKFLGECQTNSSLRYMCMKVNGRVNLKILDPDFTRWGP